MKKNIIIKNQLKENSSNKDKKKLKKIIEEIKKSLDSKKDTLHILSKKFKLNFNSSDLKRFQKFKQIILIGMGGSVLGANAIYSFLKSNDFLISSIIFFNFFFSLFEEFSCSWFLKNIFFFTS